MKHSLLAIAALATAQITAAQETSEPANKNEAEEGVIVYTVEDVDSGDLRQKPIEEYMVVDLPENLAAFDLINSINAVENEEELITKNPQLYDEFIKDGAYLEQFQDELTDYAKSFLGTKYKWGAKGPKAFDCSGFTGYVFRNFGYDIGPCSRVQATKGELVDIKDARVGDLMFFSRPSGGKTVGHVGMVIEVNPDDGSLKFIHASTKKGVTIQKFPDNGHYNRRFLQLRRVIPDEVPRT